MSKLVVLDKMSLYVPDKIPPEHSGMSALYLKSSEGADWYQAQIHFSSDTRKIAFREDGLIVSHHNNVERMWPINLSITEVYENDLPVDFPASDEPLFGWMFHDGKVIRKPTYFIEVATKRRDSEMLAASQRITALVEAQDDDDITPEEVIELAELRAYRAVLRRLDLTTTPEIEWPARSATL